MSLYLHSSSYSLSHGLSSTEIRAEGRVLQYRHSYKVNMLIDTRILHTRLSEFIATAKACGLSEASCSPLFRNPNDIRVYSAGRDLDCRPIGQYTYRDPTNTRVPPTTFEDSALLSPLEVSPPLGLRFNDAETSSELLPTKASRDYVTPVPDASADIIFAANQVAREDLVFPNAPRMRSIPLPSCEVGRTPLPSPSYGPSTAFEDRHLPPGSKVIFGAPLNLFMFDWSEFQRNVGRLLVRFRVFVNNHGQRVVFCRPLSFSEYMAHSAYDKFQVDIVSCITQPGGGCMISSLNMFKLTEILFGDSIGAEERSLLRRAIDHLKPRMIGPLCHSVGLLSRIVAHADTHPVVSQ
jgi:hypothetical protein